VPSRAHFVADPAHKRDHVGARGVAAVDDEVSVHRRNLRVADAKAFQAEFVDDCVPPIRPADF